MSHFDKTFQDVMTKREYEARHLLPVTDIKRHRLELIWQRLELEMAEEQLELEGYLLGRMNRLAHISL